MALRNRRLAALAFFLAMAVLHSWPLAGDLAHLSRLDNHDAELDTWIVAWVAHALATNPLQLFEAPIFYPEHHALAFSEHMFVPSLMGAPLLWAGLTPVFVYNVLIIAGFALSGWAMFLLIERWTCNTAAAIIAGLLYAFNAHALTRFVHLQALHVEFFPLVLYALDRVLVERTLKDAVLLAAAFVLQALCSNYLLVFTVYAMAIAVAVRWREINWPGLAIAGAISALALAPFLYPDLLVDREYHLARAVSDVTQYNAGWRDYLATGGRLHYALWSHTLFEGRTALFPGITAMVLAAIGALSGRQPAGRIRMMVAMIVMAVAISFGTALPGFALLFKVLPLFNGLRNVARWGWLALAGIAVLAGFGVAALEKWAGAAGATGATGARWRAVAVVLGVLVTVEAIRTPVGFTRFDGIPRIYDRLAAEPAAVVAEFPFFSGASVSLNGPYVLANTRYFKPLLNGYSSFHPESFMARGRALNSFPSELALAELRVSHVTHVLVHGASFARRYGQRALDAIDTIPDLQLLADEDGIKLYRLK
jgi:hypothetical protein